MKKIKIIQNAATFVSDLKVSEIEALQKQDPMALAIEEPNNCGGTDIVFNVQYKEAAYGEINDHRVIFVDQTPEGNACMTVLIPANLKDKAAYLYDTYVNAVNYLKAVERKATKALQNLTASKKEFANEFINLDQEVSLRETLEEVDIIIKAEPGEISVEPIEGDKAE
jgi:hypothetical protein